ncbi:putative glycine dehydrogenase (decarboxylating) subunit 1 [Rickettsiales bacterium]|nr:putative glycine dehydrogenase (decarboxylating) subunit 1 [Rickettsiales bacterium]
MRYLALTEKDRKEMRSKIGIGSVDELYDNLPIPDFGDLPGVMGELELEHKMLSLAQQNLSTNMFFLGAGCYLHHVSATVDYIIQRSEFLTCYTPYQPELSQGTLMTMFEFQTMICALTGMDVANASMYDGPTALAEAMLMAMRLTQRRNVHICDGLNPEYLRVLSTYIETDNIKADDSVDADAACLVIQVPDFFGQIQELSALREKCTKFDVLLIVVVTEIVSLGLLAPPSAADIVVGEGQSIGIPMSFGGPHLGFFACRQEYIRQMPGRLCGQTVDQAGRRAFTLTLNTREQHIRRERATSNICTNQGLTALAFTVHMSLLGELGFKALARLNHERACILADMLSKIKGVRLINNNFFNEFVVELPTGAQSLVDKMSAKGIVAGLAIDKKRLLLAATEMSTEENIENFVQEISAALH